MKYVSHSHDLVVIGAGLSGIAAAVTAARAGLRVALINDRPVLGGNGSKEIRVPPVGARCCNFPYSKETGLVEELLLENLFSNPSCSPEGWNLILLNCIKAEKRIELFLNTTINQIERDASGHKITKVSGYTLNAEIFQTFEAPLFADCSGEGTVADLAGVKFSSGIEAKGEFGESLCEDAPQTFTMGSSIWFTTRDANRPTTFQRPAWVNREISEDDFGPHRAILREYKQQRGGFWWLELGGDRDMVHDANLIADDLLALVYGVWDYLKNRSPLSAELATWELDWVGALPGKRESRRFQGAHVLTQNDIEEQRSFPDAVAYGGWGFDHHPKGGFFDRVSPSYHVYHRGPYNVPLRSLFARDISNLFLAGRNISATHYALSSTRVMLTCAQLGEGVGLSAAFSHRLGILPAQLAASETMTTVQQELLRLDHHLHDVPYRDSSEIGAKATVTTSSTLGGEGVIDSDGTVPLSVDRLWGFPIATGELHSIEILVDAVKSSSLAYTFWAGPEGGSHFPQKELSAGIVAVAPGSGQWVRINLDLRLSRPGAYFLELKANEAVRVHFGRMAPVGFIAYDERPEDPIRPNPFSRWKAFKSAGAADVWNVGDGTLTAQSVDFYDGMVSDMYCLRINPPQPVYAGQNVTNPWHRPGQLPNLWTSASTDFKAPESLTMSWPTPVVLKSTMILFDSALEVHLTSLWIKYQRTTVPALVSDYEIEVLPEGSEAWETVATCRENHQRRKVHLLPARPITALRLVVRGTCGLPRAQVYAIRAYT